MGGGSWCRPERRKRSSRRMVRIIALPDMKERLPALGFEPIGNTPEEFEAQIKAEIEKWARIVRDANVKTE